MNKNVLENCYGYLILAFLHTFLCGIEKAGLLGKNWVTNFRQSGVGLLKIFEMWKSVDFVDFYTIYFMFYITLMFLKIVLRNNLLFEENIYCGVKRLRLTKYNIVEVHFQQSNIMYAVWNLLIIRIRIKILYKDN